MTCRYCDKTKYQHYPFIRNKMCDECKEDYDSHLEDKADAERDERLIKEMSTYSRTPTIGAKNE